MTRKLYMFKCPPSLMTKGKKSTYYKQIEQHTFSFSWASLTVFPSFFFLHLWPSLRKYLSALRSKRNKDPAVSEEHQVTLCRGKKSQKTTGRNNTSIENAKATSHLSNIWASSIEVNTILMRKVPKNNQKARRLTKWKWLSKQHWLTLPAAFHFHMVSTVFHWFKSSANK